LDESLSVDSGKDVVADFGVRGKYVNVEDVGENASSSSVTSEADAGGDEECSSPF